MIKNVLLSILRRKGPKQNRKVLLIIKDLSQSWSFYFSKNLNFFLFCWRILNTKHKWDNYIDNICKGTIVRIFRCWL